MFTDAAKMIMKRATIQLTVPVLLKRFLQKQVETQLARALVAAEVNEGGQVSFSVKDDQLVMKSS